MLQLFTGHHPDIEVALCSAIDPEDALHEIRGGSGELGLLGSVTPITAADLRVIPVEEQGLVLVTADAGKLAGRTHVVAEDLSGRPPGPLTGPTARAGRNRLGRPAAPPVTRRERENPPWSTPPSSRWNPSPTSGPNRRGRVAAAKLVCHQCPVIDECLRHALQVREPYGVWGGRSEEERALLLGVESLRYPKEGVPGLRRPRRTDRAAALSGAGS